MSRFMKIKKDFIMREIDEEYLLIPANATALEFNGIITLNEVGAFIWKHLDECEPEAELVQVILKEYDVEEETARKDLEEFLSVFQKAKLIAM